MLINSDPVYVSQAYYVVGDVAGDRSLAVSRLQGLNNSLCPAISSPVNGTQESDNNKQ